MIINTAQQDKYRCPRCGLTDRVVKASVSEKVSTPQRTRDGAPLMYESPWGCFSVGFIIFSVAAFLFVNIVDTAIHSTTGLRDFLVTFGLIIIVILIAIHHFQKAEKSRVEVARNNAELEARNEAGRKRYQHEVEIYQQLYYCERDDVVFKLGRPETCAPASQVNSLYEFL